jgi:hypothetical protein
MVNQEYMRELWYDSRREGRIRLAMPFRLRYSKSEPFWHESVISENISRHGICINTNSRIPVQTRVYVESANRRFQALAIVVHSTPNQAGLQIIAAHGNWVIR